MSENPTLKHFGHQHINDNQADKVQVGSFGLHRVGEALLGEAPQR